MFASTKMYTIMAYPSLFRVVASSKDNYELRFYNIAYAYQSPLYSQHSDFYLSVTMMRRRMMSRWLEGFTGPCYTMRGNIASLEYDTLLCDDHFVAESPRDIARINSGASPQQFVYKVLSVV